jgi:hypothetical protein
LNDEREKAPGVLVPWGFSIDVGSGVLDGQEEQQVNPQEQGRCARDRGKGAYTAIAGGAPAHHDTKRGTWQPSAAERRVLDERAAGRTNVEIAMFSTMLAAAGRRGGMP